MTGTTRSWRSLLVAALVTVAVVAGFSATPALAAPEDPPVESNATLREVIATASKAYLEAQAALDASRKRQAELTVQRVDAEARYAQVSAQVAGIVAAAYRLPSPGSNFALLDSASPDSLLDRMTALETITARQDRKLHELSQLRVQLNSAQAGIDAETAEQAKQVAALAKTKADAEHALVLVGGAATGGYVSPTSPKAQAVPRLANGSLPAESCNQDDPTTGGCLTPRTLHGLNEARLYGYTRFTSCYRSLEDGGEHPRGRACDYSVSASGFGGAASGADRVYGNNLAAFFVRNAWELGVIYVIWYDQIWSPAVGWHAYYGNGDPSSNHENHVHVSHA